MLFKRRIEIAAAGKKITLPPFDIEFQVMFDNDPEPNRSTIHIYNVANQTINEIKKGMPVILNAGYEGDIGTVFAGEIEEASSSWSRADRILEIRAGDAIDRWLNKTVNKTYRAGIKTDQIIRDLLNIFGLEIGALKLPQNRTYANGRTISSSLQVALRQLASDSGAKLHITNGAVFMRPADEGSELAFVLNSDTGLIESPERIDSDDEREWRVVSLLNHRIRNDSIIKVESRVVTGFFRVVRCEHVCTGQEFDTRMEVAAV